VDFTNKDVTVSEKIIFVDGTPDAFIDRAASDEHFSSWADVVQDINTEGDAYADGGDEADHYDDVIINYNCLAWE
jgi:hypothetical protein